MAVNEHLKYYTVIFLVLEGLLDFVYSVSKPATCGHRPPKPDEVLRHIYLEPFHVIRKRNADQQLRIKIIYDASFYKLPPDKLEVVNQTLPAAINYWEQTLRVRPLQTPILLSRKCEGSKMFYKKDVLHTYCMNSCEKVTLCGEVVVPEEHLDICRVCNSYGMDCKEESGIPGRGIKGADFVFYVSALQTERCFKGLTIAYAAHCQLEAAFDRPIAGHANLCPDAILTRSQDKDTLFSTMKHEILHALGFSLSLFAYYRDKKGNPLTTRGQNGRPELNETLQNWQWSEKVIKSVTRSDWRVRSGLLSRTMHMMVTPRVVEEVRKHFNCSSLEGAELEDQGGEGTELTHWEKRIFENEAMTGIHTQNAVYSRITLALLEDTGWYEPNYNMAEPLLWGQDLGCDFAKKSCLHWMETSINKSSIYPFCDIIKKDSLYTSCSKDRKALTVCNLVEYTKELPPLYQNFVSLPGVPSDSVTKFGGSLMLADYCPFFQEFHWRTENVSVRGSKCIYEENSVQSENNIALEYHGNDSRCFDHSAASWEEEHCRHSRRKQNYGSGCYKFTCTDGHLNILVLDRKYTCYEQGQELQISILTDGKLHKGLLLCPACAEVCKDCLLEKNPHPYHLQNRTDILICKSLNLAENVYMLLFMITLLSTYYSL